MTAEIGGLVARVESIARRVEEAVRELEGKPVEWSATGSIMPHQEQATPSVAHPRPNGQLGPGTVDLVVHGVSDLAAAQAIRASMSRGEGIDTAEPREFSRGMLRLTLGINRALLLDDLRTTLLPFEIEEIDRGPGVVAVRLMLAGEVVS
ncbi:MAG: hypothetical protein ACR2J8_10080 [Thermomicrobiales bacterium]